ncbi:histidine kinase [Arenimonas sp.]|uniref:histidine kinase n=1 Tax=Arenimonas sp. TaxID=1872635 RepID=UPI0035B3E00B
MEALQAWASTRPRYVIAGALGALVLGVLLSGIAALEFYHWELGTGLLFVTLWSFPRRWWPWALVAAMLSHPHPGLVAPVLEPLLVMAGVIVLHAWSVRPGAEVSLRRIGRIHVVALLTAVAMALAEVLMAVVGPEAWQPDLREMAGAAPFGDGGRASLLGNLLLRHLLCDFIGILLVLPLAYWAAAAPVRHVTPSVAVLLRAVFVMGPVAGLYLWLGLAFPGSEFAELFRLLLVAAVVVFTLWQGWRGAVAAMLMISAAVALEEALGNPRMSPIVTQAYVGVVGALTLLFGASVDDFRRQAADLVRARRQEHRLLDELQDAALRNLQLEESERQRLARELHDEFGQNLAALQTHLKLAAPHLASAGRPGMADLLLEITRAMQRNISRVLSDLRPAGLEQLGLFGAVDRGSVRRLAQDAGLEMDVRLEGDARLLAQLDGTHATAIYRMAQEAVTNIVRHADARRCQLTLRISRRRNALWVFLDIRDDGLGRLDRLLPGNGITGMRDRVLALNGALYLHQLSPGLRLHLMVRQEDGAPGTGR